MVLQGMTQQDKTKHLRYQTLYQTLYDITKDTSDYYTVRSQSIIWDLVTFICILDTTLVNSKELFWIKKGLGMKKQNTFGAAFALPKSLTSPFTEQQSMNRLGKGVIHKTGYIFN